MTAGSQWANSSPQVRPIIPGRPSSLQNVSNEHRSIATDQLTILFQDSLLDMAHVHVEVTHCSYLQGEGRFPLEKWERLGLTLSLQCCEMYCHGWEGANCMRWVQDISSHWDSTHSLQWTVTDDWVKPNTTRKGQNNNSDFILAWIIATRASIQLLTLPYKHCLLLYQVTWIACDIGDAGHVDQTVNSATLPLQPGGGPRLVIN